MRHEVHDQVSLEIARRIARELPRRPELIELARTNLARWRAINADAPGLLRCYAEWEALLQEPVESICRVLTEASDDATRRHNSPFAGALSPREVWEIKSRLRDETMRHLGQTVATAAKPAERSKWVETLVAGASSPCDTIACSRRGWRADNNHNKQDKTSS